MKKDVTVIKPNFKSCILLNMQTLTNFPFIEDDFDALTNYELLCKVVEQMNIVIKNQETLDDNLISLYNAFNELKDYVDNYFENLDVQEEINNKLDDMAESGQLVDIIAQYLQTQAVYGFNTVSDMADSSSLVNGSFAKTYGNTTINDTKGAFYKIRNITNTDTIDDDKLIAITTSDTLVAEKMLDPYITIFVGDSYGVNMSTHDGWVQKYVDMYGLTLGVDAINVCIGNSGFSDPYGGTNTYLNNLQTATANIDKSKVKKIIVAGGYNDRAKTANQIEELVEDFMDYVKDNFVNAKIYVGMIANDGNIDPYHSTVVNYREWIATQVLCGYKSAEKYGAYYLNGVELVMHDYSLFDSYDFIHPKNEGVIELAKAIHEAENGNYNPLNPSMYDGYNFRNDSTAYTKDSVVNTANFNIIGYKYNGMFNIKTTGNVSFTNYQLINSTDTSISVKLGEYTTSLKYFRYTNYLSEIPVEMRLELYNSTDIVFTTGKLVLNTSGEVMLTINNNKIGTRYIQNVIFTGLGYTLPILAQ